MKHFFIILFFILGFHLTDAALNVNLGPHHNYIHLKFNNPHTLKGFLTGVTANGEYQCRCLSAFVKYEGYWSTENICGRPCQESCVSEHIAYGALKYCYCPWMKIYIGFGYNAFNNTQDPCAAHLTYHFKKWMIPIGVTLCWNLAPCFAVGVQGECRPDVHSRIEVIGENFNSKNEIAYRVQLPLVYCQNCFSIQLVPFYDWDKFGKTTEKLSNGVPFKIPALTRWDVGVRLLAGYSF